MANYTTTPENEDPSYNATQAAPQTDLPNLPNYLSALGLSSASSGAAAATPAPSPTPIAGSDGTNSGSGQQPIQSTTSPGPGWNLSGLVVVGQTPTWFPPGMPVPQAVSGGATTPAAGAATPAASPTPAPNPGVSAGQIGLDPGTTTIGSRPGLTYNAQGGFPTYQAPAKAAAPANGISYSWNGLPSYLNGGFTSPY